MTALLEREPFLLTLDELFSQAEDGRGQVALISGEAGIGKTALVESFLARHPSGMRSLWGACEALFTPRPLGPLYDIAAHPPPVADPPWRRREPRGALCGRAGGTGCEHDANRLHHRRHPLG